MSELTPSGAVSHPAGAGSTTVGADPATLSPEVLEAEITSLAGHIAAATARFLALLAAFDAVGGWQQIGLRSCEQWLSWKCGLSPTTAREQVRVARRLRVLPVIRGTFEAGQLSYSKVRALTRVATRGTEADLVGAARNATAEQVHRLCRGLTRARSIPDALASQASAAFTHHWNDDGTLRFSGRLSAEDGALLLRAIESQRDIVHGPLPEGQTRHIPVDETASAGGSGRGAAAEADLQPDDEYRSRAELAARSDAEALVRIAVHALDTPPGPVSGTPVRLIIHTSEEALAASGPLGHVRPQPADTGVGAETDTEAGADAGTGSDAGTGREAEAGAEASADAGAEPGEPTGRDLRPGGTIEAGPGLLPETIQRLACNALLEPAGDPDSVTDPEPQTAVADAEAAAPVAADAATADANADPDANANADADANANADADPDASADTDATAPVANRDHRRAANRRQRDALLRRDGGCRFPGCTRTRGLQAHHVKHHSHGGPTTMINLVLLCHHHHVLLHEGGWRLQWAAPATPSRRAGSLAAGTLLAIGPRGQRIIEAPATSGCADQLPAKHQRTITPETITGNWAGQALQLGYAVSVYAQAMEREKPSAEAATPPQ